MRVLYHLLAPELALAPPRSLCQRLFGETLSIPFIEDNDQTQARHEHLKALRLLVGNVYPNKFERCHVVDSGREDTITSIVEKFRGFEPASVDGARPAPEVIEEANQQLNDVVVRLAGRIASPPRVMGKAAFVHLSDGMSRLQIYIRKADVKAVNNDTRQLIEAEGKGWELFELLDHGDFIGAEGYLFCKTVSWFTSRGLAKHCYRCRTRCTAFRSEIRPRQRYADLIAGSLKLEREPSPRTCLSGARWHSGDASLPGRPRYVEVETRCSPPRPPAPPQTFKTHTTLDIDLYARIAELYLKRPWSAASEGLRTERNFATRHTGYTIPVHHAGVLLSYADEPNDGFV